MTVIEITEGPYTLNVKGWRRLVRDLENAGHDAQDMKTLMHEIGLIVVTAARPMAPVETGRLAASLRAGKGKTKAVVRAGGARIPYAGIVHYGTPVSYVDRRGRPVRFMPQPFIIRAFEKTRDRIYRRLFEGIGELLEKNNLK